MYRADTSGSRIARLRLAGTLGAARSIALTLAVALALLAGAAVTSTVRADASTDERGVEGLLGATAP